MPIFEFRCSDCGHIFEALFMSSSEEIKLACPGCSCEVLDRVISKTSHTVGTGSANDDKPSVSAKICPSGSCMTMDVPGPTR